MPRESPRKRHRSPAYPSLTLADAVEKCRVLFQHEKRNSFDPDVALGHWEYESGSANGMRAVAALKQYGLLEEERGEGDRELRISEQALDILLPEEGDEPTYKGPLQGAALNPTLFDEIWSRHADSGIPSDRNLERYLIKEKDFNPSAVARIIRIFRENLSFAGLVAGDTVGEAAGAENDGNIGIFRDQQRGQGDLFPNLFAAVANKTSDKRTDSSPMIDLPLTLPSLKIAVLRLPAQMDERDFETLVTSINAWRHALVKKANLPVTVQELPEDKAK